MLFVTILGAAVTEEKVNSDPLKTQISHDMRLARRFSGFHLLQCAQSAQRSLRDHFRRHKAEAMEEITSAGPKSMVLQYVESIKFRFSALLGSEHPRLVEYTQDTLGSCCKAPALLGSVAPCLNVFDEWRLREHNTLNISLISKTTKFRLEKTYHFLFDLYSQSRYRGRTRRNVDFISNLRIRLGLRDHDEKLSSVIGVLAILLAISSPAFAVGGGSKTETSDYASRQESKAQSKNRPPVRKLKRAGGNGSPAAREGGLGAGGNNIPIKRAQHRETFCANRRPGVSRGPFVEIRPALTIN